MRRESCAIERGSDADVGAARIGVVVPEVKNPTCFPHGPSLIRSLFGGLEARERIGGHARAPPHGWRTPPSYTSLRAAPLDPDDKNT